MTLNQSNIERLDMLKKKTGFSEFIINFALRLKTEPEQVSLMVKNMEESIRFAHVDKWADNTNMIGKIGEVTRYDISDSTSKTSIAMDTVSGMSSDNPDELGGLRVFNYERNNEFLDKISASSENSESLDETSARMLVEQAYGMNDSLAVVNGIPTFIDEAKSLDNSNFVVDA